MKTTKYFLSAVLVVGALSGCSSSWNQDPLAGKDGVMKDPLPKPTNPEAPKQTNPNAVVIAQDPEYYYFTEGSAGELTFSARILLPDYKGRVVVENLADFPGATFDEANGVFRWTPPLGTVVKDLEAEKALKVVGVGEKADRNDTVRGEITYSIKIKKTLSAPEIFSISTDTLSLREGEYQNIQIKIRDKDAMAGDRNTWPKILALPALGYSNLSQFVKVTRISDLPNNEFVIDLRVDLEEAELTKSKTSYGFLLQALSQYNQQSNQRTVAVNVLTSFAQAQSTWYDTLEVFLGQKTEFQFMIFDPKEELFVGAPSFTGGPAAVSFSCSGIGVSRQLCKMTFAPDMLTTIGEYMITAKTTLKNQDASDTKNQDQNITLKLKVTDAAPSSKKEGR